tara:strand:- start:3643 stop:4737 length:1095 start_codon:yes stop_codon:yes gene_type:complete
MKKFLESDNGNPDGTAKDRNGAVAGTLYKAIYYNDNIFNLFEFVTSQGYTLIDADISQLAKANKALYNASYIYNTSAISTQSVDDIVEGSDGYYYKVLTDATTGDNPVGSVTGAWLKVPYDKQTDISSLTAKTTPVDADELVLADSASSFSLKKFTWANLKPTLKTYFETFFISKLPELTGTATFTNSTNNILLTGVGALAGLEVGDVIKVTNSVSNNKEFTVEVITDANNIIVNQSHAGGTSTKSLTNETTTAGVTVAIFAKRYNAPIGLGQGWVVVTATRTTNLVYNNNTNRSIGVNISRRVHSGSTSYTSTFEIDGEEVSDNTTSGIPQIDIRIDTNFIVGKDSDYESKGTALLVIWTELR